MTRQSQEKFPPRKVGDTVKVRVSDPDRGRCCSRNILGVITEVNLSKGLYRIGTKEGMLKSWCTRNQFTTCTSRIIDIAYVSSTNISLRECAGKSSVSGRESLQALQL